MPAAPPPAKSARPATVTVVARRRTAAPAPAPRPSNRLPGWGDLGGSDAPRPTSRTEQALARVTTVRFVAVVVLLATAFTLYVGHTYATQALLEDLQAARRDNQRLHLRLNRLHAAFDAATGPAVVIPRALELGLEEGVAYGPDITVEAE